MKYHESDVCHYPRQLAFRSPYGALPSGGHVTLRVKVSARLAHAECMLVYAFEGEEYIRRMENSGAWFSAEITMSEGTGLVYYYFIINDGASLTYAGVSQDGSGCKLYDQIPASFRITLYKEDFTTPDWFKNAVMYQIFVDRFARGEGSGGLERIAAHTDKGRRIYAHADWREQPVYKALEGETDYSPCDFFGGDLEGVINKLEYLASLGVTCLYLNPIFESPSNHKYNASDYLNVDPMFGGNEVLARLCARAKALGMRVMLDGVFSHTGDDSIYFNRYGRYDSVGACQGETSPYYKWYTFTSFPDAYKSWWGFKTLPEVNELEPGYLKFICDGVLQKWADAGIGGWRLDVADELPEEFLRALRTTLKRLDPESVLLGEVWEDASTKVSMGVSRRFVMGEELDSVMNYPFANGVLAFLRGRITAPAFKGLLEGLRENYPREVFYALMNLISSHDVPRAASLLGGAPDKGALTREQEAQYRLPPEGEALAKKRMKLASAVQFFMPGVPCIYYGDEALAFGLMDPFNRCTYPWGSEDGELTAHYRALSQLRKANTAIRTGGCLFDAQGEDVLLIIRFDGMSAYALAVNRSDEARPLVIDASAVCEGPDAGKFKHVPIKSELEPLSARIFKLK